MGDVVMVGLIVVSVLVFSAYVVACDRIVGRGDPGSHGHRESDSDDVADGAEAAA